MHVLLDWYAVIFIFEVLRPSDECGVEDTVFAALAGFLIHYLYLNIKMAIYFIEHYGEICHLGFAGCGRGWNLVIEGFIFLEISIELW